MYSLAKTSIIPVNCHFIVWSECIPVHVQDQLTDHKLACGPSGSNDQWKVVSLASSFQARSAYTCSTETIEKLWYNSVNTTHQQKQTPLVDPFWIQYMYGVAHCECGELYKRWITRKENATSPMMSCHYSSIENSSLKWLYSTPYWNDCV